MNTATFLYSALQTGSETRSSCASFAASETMARSYVFPLDSSPSSAATVVSKECTAAEETSLRLSLLPESARDVAENEEVWRVAQRGAFEPSRAKAFTSRDVLAMSLPTELYTLLRSLSWSALRASLLEILALVVEDEDPGDSLSAVLDQATGDALRRYMAIRRELPVSPARSRTGGLQPRELAHAVEILLRVAEKSDHWRVPVTCLYVRTAKGPDARRCIRDLSEERFGKHNQGEHNALWTLYSLHTPLQKALKDVDAAELSTLLCEAVKREPHAVLQALQLRSTLIAAKMNAHAFTELPVDVVEEHIVPNILLTFLQAVAARELVPSAADAALSTQIGDFRLNDWAAQAGVSCEAPPGYASAPEAAAVAAAAQAHPSPSAQTSGAATTTSLTRT